MNEAIDNPEHETIVEAGDMVRDLANEMEAFQELVNARRMARFELTKKSEPKPDAMEGLKAQHRDVGDWPAAVWKIHVKAMRERHAAVIAEIEAGSRDESDRAEADRLLAAALTPPVLMEDAEARS